MAHMLETDMDGYWQEANAFSRTVASLMSARYRKLHDRRKSAHWMNARRRGGRLCRETEPLLMKNRWGGLAIGLLFNRWSRRLAVCIVPSFVRQLTEDGGEPGLRSLFAVAADEHRRSNRKCGHLWRLALWLECDANRVVAAHLASRRDSSDGLKAGEAQGSLR